MIVLFGSHARGDWVEDIHTEDSATHVYLSDFDILVTTKLKRTAGDANAHDRVEKALDAEKKIKTPYSIIYHSFGQVKQMITEGHYFFSDIKQQGVRLYLKNSKFNLGSVKVLTPQQRKTIAQKHFKQWFKSANSFYIQYGNALNIPDYKNAAFQLHQATERFYSAVTLVFINYRFRSHDLARLSRKVVSYDPRFAEVFPRATARQRTAYNRLKKAYIDARYNENYKITKNQLEYLATRVKQLQRLTKEICKEKIESFV